ncbi:MAG: DUF1800 domain-containing protein [Proteobacteria bacterium]|nr:DUF1800 domain-containing protein [Pseudomonadota bacterium]
MPTSIDPTRIVHPSWYAPALAAWLAGCTAQTNTPAHAPPTPEALARLDRLTYGADRASIDALARLGVEGFLERQFARRPAPLPAGVAATISALEISRVDGATLLAEAAAERHRIDGLRDEELRAAARKALNERGNELAAEAVDRELMRAVYSPDQLREQMVWFWLNHFSVYLQKGSVRWLYADYAERAVRPNALGHFRELVMATLRHPAMLEYLDNARNGVGHINENYARELLELHTLGVDGGYGQADVQALAHILTGVGVRAEREPPRLRREWRSLYRRDGAFEFNPARHDFAPKRFLGETIEGRGFAEVERAVDRIVREPACGRFVSRRLAAYFVADDPPAALVERMAATFRATDGDIAAVLRTLFTSAEFSASLGSKFKDPVHYVYSALRLAYDGRPILNPRPATQWLRALGEAPGGRQTPDGYPLGESGWASSGQMTRRFEVARAIGAAPPALFAVRDLPGAEPARTAPAAGVERIAGDAMRVALEPRLGTATRGVLAQARGPAEWNALLLSSPEFNYR